MSNNPLIMIFFSFIGILLILLAFLNKQLVRRVGMKPMSEVFTTPNFQRSAKITENLGRLLSVVLGVGFLVQGVGTQFVSSEVTYTVSIILLGLLGLIMLVVLIVVLANWKAK